MADSKPEQALDILQQTINDILIQTGKALKAAQSQGPRNVEQVRSILTTRMTESVDIYHRALDDVEHEIVHAKSVLTRDLEKLRAAKASSMSPVAIKNETPKPVFQSPVPIPTIPKAAKAPTPKMQQKQIQQQQQQMRNAAAQNMAASRPVAPIPDMGIDIPAPSPAQSVTSPVVIKKEAKASSATPKTKASTLANGGKGEAKRSPAIKSSTPIPIPVIPTAQTQAPSSVQTPVPVPPVPAAAMTPAPPAPTAPPAPMSVMDTSQFGLPPSMAGGTNFTDMEFTVAQGSDPANHTPGHSMSLDMGGNIDTIDLDSFFDAPVPTGAQSGPAPTASMSIDSMPGPSNPKNQPPPLNHDDIYDLGSATTESMDLDFALGQGGGSTSYIDDLFFGSGDGSMGDLADFN